MHYQNPIIPGFNPDPSITRKGDDYYLVTSSFEFFPGVPVYHSRDLTHWHRIGHALDRESQLALRGARASGGIYAPTIRYHQGMFYMTTTNVTGGGNLIVHAQDPAGPWSDPVWIEQDGIDPSLFFDEDGKVYFTSTQYDHQRQGIGMCQVDPLTGQKLSDTRILWYGTGGRYPEAPHIYRVGAWYYLMIAEGGTEFGHMVTIARSQSPWGPYQGCPHNPILTHRDGMFTRIAGVGHADLVQDPQGGWWMVCLGYRLSQMFFHHLGREVFLAPVQWEDGWPVVNQGRLLEEEMDAPGLPDPAPWPQPPVRDFLMERGREWFFLRNPREENYRFGVEGMTLTAGEDGLDGTGAPTMLLRRQEHFAMRTETEVSPRRLGPGGRCGMTLFYNGEHHYDLYLTQNQQGYRLQLTKTVADIVVTTADIPWDAAARLRIEADRDVYRFSYAWPGSEDFTPLGSGVTRLLSTEATPLSFTGVVIGLFATGDCEAVFRYFDYEPREEKP